MDTKKDLFYEKLNEIVKTSTDRSVIMSTEKYEMLLEETKQSQLLKRNNQPLSSKQYRRLRRYDILKIGDSEKLVEFVADSTSSRIRYFCKTDELFDVLEKAHAAVGHKRSRVMEEELKKQYCNVTRAILNLYLSLCEQCKLKKRIPRGIALKPNLADCLNSRCQVNLIDMPEQDNEYRFILDYQDHSTKFTVLRPLKTTNVKEIAHQLIDIFSLFGAPCILQSENGLFAKEVIKNVSEIWPGLKLVYGNLQSSEDESNQEIRKMLQVWTAKTNSQNWSQGLPFIQSQKNRAPNMSLKKTPHETMFGSPQKMGLADSSIPTDIYAPIETEEDLQELILSLMKDSQENQKTTEYDEQINKVDVPQNSYLERVDVKEEPTKMDAVEQIDESSIKIIEIIKVESVNFCAVCENATSESYQCSECHENVHIICGQIVENKALGKRIICNLCLRKKSIKVEPEQADSGLGSDSTILDVEVGSNVIVTLPEVDIGSTSSKNVLCVVMSINPSNLYQLGNQEGLLNRLYACEEFTLSKTRIINVYDVPLTSSETLRTAAMLSSGNQAGLIVCHCKRYCIDKKCKCRSKNLQCNSKCHSNSSCKNK